jgi:hypothetical protein
LQQKCGRVCRPGWNWRSCETNRTAALSRSPVIRDAAGCAEARLGGIAPNLTDRGFGADRGPVASG